MGAYPLPITVRLPKMHPHLGDHSSIALSSWQSFARRIRTGYAHDVISLNGRNLDIAAIVAAARYGPLQFFVEYTHKPTRHGVAARVDAYSLSRLNESRAALEDDLDKGMVIYGKCNSNKALASR